MLTWRRKADRVAVAPSGDPRSDVAEEHRAWRLSEVAIRETLSPVERLEMLLHPWVSFAIMPLFAVANAGMMLSLADVGASVTLAVFVGFTLGKPAGIFGFGWLAVRSGVASRPPEMSWGMLAAGGLLAGIGFTMALLIADLAFDAARIDAVKLGILSASVASAAGGVAALALATRGQPGSREGSSVRRLETGGLATLADVLQEESLMGRQETRARIASELFTAAVREEHLLRVDRGPEGRGDKVEFKEGAVESIAEACVRAADKLLDALDREPAD